MGGVDVTLPHPYLEMDFCRRLRKAGYAVVQASGVEAVVEKEPDYRSICGKEESDVLPLTEAKKNLQKTWKKADHFMIRAIIRTLRKAEKRLRYDRKR